jgi:hypothetical protein
MKTLTKILLGIVIAIIIFLFLVGKSFSSPKEFYNISASQVVSPYSHQLNDTNNTYRGFLEGAVYNFQQTPKEASRVVKMSAFKFNSYENATLFKEIMETKKDKQVEEENKEISIIITKDKVVSGNCVYWKTSIKNVFKVEKTYYINYLCIEKNFVLLTEIKTESPYAIFYAKDYNKQMVNRLRKS